MSEARRVAARAAAKLDAILGDVERWCAVLATTGDAAALIGLANMVAHRLEELGLAAELVDVEGAPPYLHASLEGAGTARVALLCHHDTVLPTSADWVHGSTTAGFTASGSRTCGAASPSPSTRPGS